MPVVEAEDGLAVQPNHVYVIPPNRALSLIDGHLRLTLREPSPQPFMPIDIFFESLAETYQNRAIGVVLSGFDGDGAEGLRLIKRAGGITFAQSQETAQFSDMPNTAVETGEVDFILPPADIAQALAEIAQHPYLSRPEAIRLTQPGQTGSESSSDSSKSSSDSSEASSDSSEASAAVDQRQTTEADSEQSLSQIYVMLKSATGADFSQYKRTTFERRLKRRLALYRLSRIDDYVDYLREDPAEVRALYRDVLITVTSFFRDSEAFSFLKESVFPAIVEQKNLDAPIRLWVAGCATGEECYSLAICLLEFLSDQSINPSIQIFGTDISEAAIEVARQGMYPENRMEGVSAERRQRFFIRTDGHYQISKAVRELCVFARQNLGGDPPFSNIDLISCRNVLIYFTPALQQRVRAIFHYSLNANGFLWLGSSESVGETSELFSVVDKKHKVYSRSPAVNRLSFDFVISDHTALNPHAKSEGSAAEDANYFNVQRQADQIVLSRYAPVGAVIDDRLNILHFRGDTSPYLRPAPGEPSFNLLKMIQPSLLLELRSAIDRAKAQEVRVRREGAQLEGNPRYIQIEVTPMKNPLSLERNYLVLFEEGALIELGSVEPDDHAEDADETPPTDPNVARLEQELAATKQELLDTQAYLQATIEEHESTSQRITTANEEILSSNEELQSTNEELQTAKEEIQAANEELKTTNEELQGRNAAARSSNNDLLNLLNNVKLPVIMLSSDLRIRRFTPAAQQVFNLIPGDIGRPISNIRIDLEVPEFEALILQVIETLEPQEQEVRDSAGRWYQLRIRPYRTAENLIDGAVIALIDISHIKQTLRQLEKARTYAEQIVETVRQPLVVLTAELEVNTANRAFYEMFRVFQEETEGQLLFELGNGQWNIPSLRAALMSLLADGGPRIQNFEITYDSEQRGRRSLLIDACEICEIGAQETKNGMGQMILLSIEDITERQQAEAERIQLVQAEAARTEAEAANISKDEFLSVLSHELRNPLNGISGWVKILLESSSPDPALLNRALHNIDRCANTQIRMVEDLLQVSRIVQGQLELQPKAVNLTELVSSAVDVLLPTAERENIQFLANLDDSPCQFYIDPDRLRQALNNVLSNAIKFTPAGGQVSVQLTYTDEQASIVIADTGRGIVPDFLPYVFERFRQEDRSTTRQYGGLGLGLTIVKTFVEAHDGTVQINSPGLGLGTTLTIKLPLTIAFAPIETATPLPSDEDLLSDLRIMVVEDNPDNLEILTMMIEMQGATVVRAMSAQEAMTQLVEEEVIDVLVSDISLPGEDGLSFIRRVRATISARDLPAIAVTGYAAASDRAEISEAGFQRYLAKPVDMNELIATIVDLVTN